MVERVRCLFTSAEEKALLQKALDEVPDGRKYQAAMQFVIECRGWAAHWLGEVLRTKEVLDKAYLAFRSAFAKWKVVSPERAKGALVDSDSLVEKLADNSLATCGDWECEEMYRNWLRI